MLACDAEKVEQSPHGPPLGHPGALHGFAREELPQLLEETVRRCLSRHEQIQEARLQDLLREEHVPLNVSLVRVSSQIANSASSASASEVTATRAKLDELEAKVDRLLDIVDGDRRARDDFPAEQTRDIVSDVVAERTASLMWHLERLSAQLPSPPTPKGQARRAGLPRLTREQHSQTCGLMQDTPAAEGEYEASPATPAPAEALPGSGGEGKRPSHAQSPSHPTPALGESPPGGGGSGKVQQHPVLRMLQRRSSDIYQEHIHSIQEYRAQVRTQSGIQVVVRSYFFEAFFVAVIIAHMIYMIVQTDSSFGLPPAGVDYVVAESGFVLIYCAELAMKLSADGWQIFCGPSQKSNLLDLLLILTAGIDIISVTVVHEGAVQTMALKGIRMLRLQKMLRLHKVFGMSNDTQLLLHGLGSCAGVLVGAALIVFLYFLIGGIFFAQAVSHYILESRAELSDEQLDYYVQNFGSVFQCMFTLYQGLASNRDLLSFYDALTPVWGGGLLAVAFILFHFVYVVLMVNVVSSMYVQKILLYSVDQTQSVRLQQQRHDRKDTQFLLEQCEMKLGVGDTINYKDFLNLMHSSEEVREMFEVRSVALEDATTLHKMLARKPPGQDTAQEWMCVADRRHFFDSCMRVKRDVTTSDVARSSDEFRRFVRSQNEHRDQVQATLASMRQEIISMSHNIKKLRSGT